MFLTWFLVDVAIAMLVTSCSIFVLFLCSSCCFSFSIRFWWLRSLSTLWMPTIVTKMIVMLQWRSQCTYTSTTLSCSTLTPSCILLRVTCDMLVGLCIAWWTRSLFAMATHSDWNCISRLDCRKSLDWIIALQSITLIEALFDLNLLIRLAYLSIGSHTNRLVYYRHGS